MVRNENLGKKPVAGKCAGAKNKPRKCPCALSARFHMQEGLAEKILMSLKPELGGAHEKRSRTAMDINKNVLSLEIRADDLTALKASFNSHMKLIILCTEFGS